MSIGKIIAGGVIVVGAFPIVAGITKLFVVVFAFFFVTDCSMRSIGIPLFMTDAEWETEWEETRKETERRWESDIWAATVIDWMNFETGKFDKAAALYATPADQPDIKRCRGGNKNACTKLRGKWVHIEHRLESSTG